MNKLILRCVVLVMVYSLEASGSGENGGVYRGVVNRSRAKSMPSKKG